MQKHRTETEEIDELLCRTEEEVQLDYGYSNRSQAELNLEGAASRAEDASDADQLMQQMKLKMMKSGKTSNQLKDFESRFKALKGNLLYDSSLNV